MNQGSSQENQLLSNFAAFLSCTLIENKDDGGLVSIQSAEDFAQQLQLVISHSVGADVKCCSVPCMSLKHQDRSASSSASRSSLEQAAATSLASALEVSKMELLAVPTLLVRNIANTFMSLVGSRIRSYVAALMSQSKKDSANQKQILLVANLLSSSSSTLIKPTAIVSSFRVIEASTLAAGNHQVSPLVQETVMDLNVLGQTMTVNLRGTGSIIGVFDEGGSHNSRRISKASVLLDTTAFLNSMMSEVREAVRKAVAITSNVVIQSISSGQNGSNSSSNNSGAFAEQSMDLVGNNSIGGLSSDLSPEFLTYQQEGKQEFSMDFNRMIGGNSFEGMPFNKGLNTSVTNQSNHSPNGSNGWLLESQFVTSRASGEGFSAPKNGGIALLTRAAGTLNQDFPMENMMHVTKKQQQMFMGDYDLSKPMNHTSTPVTAGVQNFEEV